MPPKQIESIELRDQPGWITFSIDGKYAYPSTGDVIDARVAQDRGPADRRGKPAGAERKNDRNPPAAARSSARRSVRPGRVPNCQDPAVHSAAAGYGLKHAAAAVPTSSVRPPVNYTEVSRPTPTIPLVKSHRSRSYERSRPPRHLASRVFAEHRPVAAATALTSMVVPKVHAAEDNTIQRGAGRLRRARRRRGRQRAAVAERPDQAGRHGRRLSRTARRGATTALKRAAQRASGRARGPQVHRLRRLPEGDGLPAAGRRRNLCHAAGLPLGAFHLCDPKGPQRLHGKAGHGRRPDLAQDAGPGGRSRRKRTSRSASA